MSKNLQETFLSNTSLFTAVVDDTHRFDGSLSKKDIEEFYAKLSQFKAFLELVLIQCSHFDLTIPSYGERMHYIQTVKNSIFSVFDQHFLYLNMFTQKLNRKDYKFLQKKYQAEIIPIFTKALLNKMIYEKPLGYAGDFIMMKHYYNDDFSGNTSFEVLSLRYTLERPVSRANINRKNIFKDKIINKINKKKGCKICSFGCGPAMEFIEILKENIDLSSVEFIFIDIEKKAFEFLKESIQVYSDQSIKTVFLPMDLRSLIFSNSLPCELKELDFVYASGIFDYFNDRTAKKLLNFMVSILSETGSLMVVNVAKDHDAISYMEFLGEWILHLRNELDLQSLTRSIPGNPLIQTRKDPENGTNIYLEIIK